jgi:predicted phosphodiesterase
VKIALASDLHYEFHGPGSHVEVPAGTDVLILAGDIGTIATLPHALKHYASVAPHMLYVTGNHEFYGHGAADQVDDLIADVEAECPNLKRLTTEKGVVEIGGVAFAGDTLWFGDPDGLNQIYEKTLADFTAIRWRDVATAKWIADQHARAKQFFQSAKADVFITHHMPSEALITPKWARSPINRFFASEVFQGVTHPPKVWCYGHTHDSSDRVLGDTRFLCNPKGYPHERSGVYEVKSFTIEV